ncbi:MAG: TIGR03087 family PEP-CTERM/XrtA system glycosyltransferase [Thermoguttaceae bacterium]|nr:TIGR03087 family PEP-CTERM/XrtA system glycosyltransferase [Thermoguttaceae bacterium]
MDILFITHRFPHPPNRGDSIRSFHFLERFSRMGNLHLATLYDEEPSVESHRVLNELCAGVLACRWGQHRKWIKAGMALLSGRTMTEGLFFNRKFRAGLKKLVSEKKFDRIVVFCSSMFQYLDVLTGTINEKTPVIVDLVDVDSQKWFDYSSQSRGWKKYVFQIEGKRLRRLERWIGAECSALLAVTPEEIALYRDFAGEEVLSRLHSAAVPNGVDTKYFDPQAPELSEISEFPERLVFVGALDYRANVEGVEWFVRNVFPELRRDFPNCEFDIVGSRPVPLLKHFSETIPGINLAASVPDVRPYLKRASVVIVPLQVARGLQNKVLEACAMARPVIASDCAAEGIQNRTAEDFLVCRTATEWKSALSFLLQNPEVREKYAGNGRKMIEKYYAWAAQLDRLESLVRDIPEGNGISNTHSNSNQPQFND